MNALTTDPSKIILLVEDNPDDVELTLRALKKNNIHNDVVVAPDGETALDYLFGTGAYAGTTPPLPEIILLDLKLPRISGLEVLRQLRDNERTRYVPVVILTSSTEETDLVHGYQFGANSYVHKLSLSRGGGWRYGSVAGNPPAPKRGLNLLAAVRWRVRITDWLEMRVLAC